MKKNILNRLLIVLALLSYSGVFAQDKEITLESIYLKPEFNSKGPGEFNSMKDGSFYSYMDDSLNIKVYDYETGTLKNTLMKGDKFKSAVKNNKISVRDYKFSGDETKILISTDIERIYRTSFIANFYVWDINNNQITKITKDSKAQLAEFSPDGSKVLYISGNNIFLYDLNSKSVKQITNDGKKNFIINGTSDWVYEEELSLSKAFSWSPDSKKLAFMKFDESKVKEMNLTFYGDLYPNESTYKYPKAGEDNSVVTVWVYDLSDSKSIKVDVGENTDQYIARIKFTMDANQLSVFRLNRLQNKLDILYADASTGKSKVVFSEENRYYISESYDLTFLKDGRFLRVSDRDGYAHIYLHDKDGRIKSQVTSGKYEVNELKGVNEENGTVYFTAFSPDGINKDIYIVNLDGSNKKQISYKDGFNNATFSSGFKYYVSGYSDGNTPGYYELHRKDGTLVKVLQENKALVEKIKDYNFTTKDFF